MSGSVILRCGCLCDQTRPAAAFQERRYGKGMRVHTIAAKEAATCTCCGSSQRYTGAGIVKKKSGSGGSGGAKSFVAVPPPEGWPGGSDYAKNGWKQL